MMQVNAPGGARVPNSSSLGGISLGFLSFHSVAVNF